MSISVVRKEMSAQVTFYCYPDPLRLSGVYCDMEEKIMRMQNPCQTITHENRRGLRVYEAEHSSDLYVQVL